MKNQVFILFIFISLSAAAQTPAYFQWQNYYITPKYDQLQSFGEGLHEHNKMYHQSEESPASVWRVDSGPNVGKWVFSRGPHTFGDLDNDLGDEHMAHFRNKVLPSVHKIEDGGIWRMENDYSYIPEGFDISKARLIVHDLANGRTEGYDDAMKKLAEATAKMTTPSARIFLRRVGFHNDDMDSAVFLGFTNWGDIDDDISKVYEEVHGKGSWGLFLEAVNSAMNGSFEERWTHVPYLSGISANE